MTEINFKDTDLSKIKYTKVAYNDLDGILHETKVEIKFLSDKYIQVFFKPEEQESPPEDSEQNGDNPESNQQEQESQEKKAEFKIECPQTVTIKFVIEDAMYYANVELKEYKEIFKHIYFTMYAPQKLIMQQNRKYFRIDLKRSCVLIATDSEGKSVAYMSRLVDVSGGGILIHKLESMFDDEIITITPSDYERFNIILFLDLEIVLKLSARFVRQVSRKNNECYAFEFTDMTQQNTDIICRYVTKEQNERLKLEGKMDKPKNKEEEAKENKHNW